MSVQYISDYFDAYVNGLPIIPLTESFTVYTQNHHHSDSMLLKKSDIFFKPKLDLEAV